MHLCLDEVGAAVASVAFLPYTLTWLRLQVRTWLGR